VIDEALSDGRLSSMKRALAEIRERSRNAPPFRLSIARTFTLETQADALAFALALIPCSPEVFIGDYGVLEPLLFDPSSAIFASDPSAVLVLWRLQDLHPDLCAAPNALTGAQRERAFEEVRDRIEALTAGFRNASSAPLFLSTFPPVDPVTLSDLTAGFGLGEIVARLNAAILALAARSSNVYVFDFAAWAARAGSASFDRKLDLFARQPIAASALKSFAFAVARTLRPLLVAPRKVLVLDLDNVLWGGILGEDGIDGLQIGHDFPGSVYRRIQLLALDLKARGVLLALVSKNNPADVTEAFAARPDMPLELGDFSAIRINWEAKSLNLRSIAAELNLGVDALAFVDDQAFELEEVRHELPEVALIEGGRDPLGILRALEETPLFDALRLSETDRVRSQDYAAQRQRAALEVRAPNLEDFLHSLELHASIEPVDERSFERAAQLIAKTNQFNVTTRRHGPGDLRRLLDEPGTTALTLSLRDRFGDQGIVGLAIAIRGDAAGERRLDTFLLSCRALGRGAERALWARLLDELARAGATVLRAEYLATAKNAQVEDLFDRFGMRQTEASEMRRRYVLALPAAFEAPQWIAT